MNHCHYGVMMWVTVGHEKQRVVMREAGDAYGTHDTGEYCPEDSSACRVHQSTEFHSPKKIS